MNQNEIDDKIQRIASAIQESDSIADLGHCQTVRDALLEGDAMRAGVASAVHDTDNTDDSDELARAIGDGIGQLVREEFAPRMAGDIETAMEGSEPE